MTPKLVGVPKLGNPSPYICSECGQMFGNRTPDDQSRIQRHLILHVPDSTRRWSLMDAWLAEQNQRNESTNASP